MLISLCIPVHNRTHDLKAALPFLLIAAKHSPPTEIVIIDYNSQDDLTKYIFELDDPTVKYFKYTGRDHYHMAHARNLTIRAAQGEYVVILSADICPAKGFIAIVRDMLKDGYVWMHGQLYTGAIVCQRAELVAAGGYDERFEFYGPEDTDLNDRLTRRGGKFGLLPPLLNIIPTPNEQKIRNYRLPLSKREMYQRMKPIYEENKAAKTLVANQGQEWGRF